MDATLPLQCGCRGELRGSGLGVFYVDVSRIDYVEELPAGTGTEAARVIALRCRFCDQRFELDSTVMVRRRVEGEPRG